MRILLISDYGYPAGGAELMIQNLRDELRRRGHEAELLTTGISHTAGDVFSDHQCFGTESGFRTALQVVNPWARRRLKRLLREFRPDVVHIRLFLTQLSPLILPVLENIPTIYHVAWYRPICLTGTKHLPDGTPCTEPWGRACWRNRCVPRRDWPLLMTQMALFERWRPHLDRVVANSGEVRDKLLGQGFESVDVIHNGIPVTPLNEPRSPSPVVSFAGRLVPEKGAHVLIRAMKVVCQEIPGARLLVAGDGPERPALEQLAESLGLQRNVDFLGQVLNEDLPEATREAAVQAVPSVWAEPFGVAAIEAMMRGRVVVASNHGGLAEIVEDGHTGLLVKPGDEQALAESLLSLIKDPERTRTMGEAAHERVVAHFSLETFCDRFESLYREMRPGR